MSCWIAGFGSESDTVSFRTLSAWADGQTIGASLVRSPAETAEDGPRHPANSPATTQKPTTTASSSRLAGNYVKTSRQRYVVFWRICICCCSCWSLKKNGMCCFCRNRISRVSRPGRRPTAKRREAGLYSRRSSGCFCSCCGKVRRPLPQLSMAGRCGGVLAEGVTEEGGRALRRRSSGVRGRLHPQI